MTEKDLTIQELRQKLKEYTDTGITAAERDPKKLARLLDIVIADEEGRLVVLPCKVGETAWVKDQAGVPREMRLEAPDIRLVCTDEDIMCMSLCRRTPDGLCAYRIKNDGSDVGDKILLTRNGGVVPDGKTAERGDMGEDAHQQGVREVKRRKRQ